MRGGSRKMVEGARRDHEPWAAVGRSRRGRGDHWAAIARRARLASVQRERGSRRALEGEGGGKATHPTR